METDQPRNGGRLRKRDALKAWITGSWSSNATAAAAAAAGQRLRCDGASPCLYLLARHITILGDMPV